VLTARECLTLARPLLRGELTILAGLLAMVLRMHSGLRSSIDPATLVPRDSSLARDAEVAAQDLLTPALLNHSSAYTWGAAIAALHAITFDRELLYLAAMFHDTGIPSPVPDVSPPTAVDVDRENQRDNDTDRYVLAAQSTQVTGAADEEHGLEAHRANRPTRLRSPNKAPVPDRPDATAAPRQSLRRACSCRET
jgi:hypothetical protein